MALAVASQSVLSYRERTATEMNVLTAAICFANRYDQINIAALVSEAPVQRLEFTSSARAALEASGCTWPRVFFLCDGDVFLLLFSSLILWERATPWAMIACSRHRPRLHTSPRSQADVTVTPFPWPFTCHFMSIFLRFLNTPFACL